MPATGPKNITEAQMITALRKHAGVYVLAARELGCDRSNIVQRVARSKALQHACEEIKAEIGDICKGVIYDALIKKDKPMARWYAERQLGNEGFRTSTALTDPDGKPLQIAAAPVTINIEFVTPAEQMDDVV